MISLRQHTISLIAVFLALAVGVVLGSGLLSGSVLSGLRDDRDGLQGEVEDLQSRNNAVNQQLVAADEFDAAVAGRVVAGSLSGRSVVVITTPDADPGDVEGVGRIVTDAGGSISGRIGLTEAFVSAASGDDLRTRLTNVIPAGAQLRTGSVDQGSLAGDLLGTVLLLNAQTAQPQSTPEELGLALDTLRGGGFITYDDGAVAPGQLAVVISGNAEDSGADGNRGAIVARFAGALDARGAGTVLAGRSGSAEGSGPVAVVRSDSALASSTTTVDDIERISGRITVALALAEQLAGASGRYGTGPGAAAVTVGAASN